MRKPLYELFDVDENADIKDITQSYRKLMLQYHSDKDFDKDPMEKEAAEEKTKQINQAYEILSHIGRRWAYDNGYLNEQEKQIKHYPFGGFKQMIGRDNLTESDPNPYPNSDSSSYSGSTSSSVSDSSSYSGSTSSSDSDSSSYSGSTSSSDSDSSTSSGSDSSTSSGSGSSTSSGSDSSSDSEEAVGNNSGEEPGNNSDAEQGNNSDAEQGNNSGAEQDNVASVLPPIKLNQNQFFENNQSASNIIDNEIINPQLTVQELSLVVQTACTNYVAFHKWGINEDKSTVNRNLESGYFTVFRHWNAKENADTLREKITGLVDGMEDLVIHHLHMFFINEKTQYDNHSLSCYLLEGLIQCMNEKRVPYDIQRETLSKEYWLELKKFLQPLNIDEFVIVNPNPNPNQYDMI